MNAQVCNDRLVIKNYPLHALQINIYLYVEYVLNKDFLIFIVEGRTSVKTYLRNRVCQQFPRCQFLYEHVERIRNRRV